MPKLKKTKKDTPAQDIYKETQGLGILIKKVDERTREEIRGLKTLLEGILDEARRICPA